MLTDVIEHLHESPRHLANILLSLLKRNGLLLITVPNAINIRERISVARGRTNYPPFESFFWSDVWRGHVREYTKAELEALAEGLGRAIDALHACDHMRYKVPRLLRPAYRLITGLFPGWKDSWMLIARKPED
jgi:hypothetical protein